jgi:hypothetical protein
MRPLSNSLISVADNLKKAHDFATVAKRMYGGFGKSKVYSEDLGKEFRKKFDPIAEEFLNTKL